jgi:simple sugar transport system permease protein
MNSRRNSNSGNKFLGWFGRTSDTNLLLTITIVVFFLMYIGAIVFQGQGFLKPQTFFNLLNSNAALIITSCGMSLVMICGGIDISVGGVVALVSMSCAVYLDFHDGNILGAIGISLMIGLAFGLVQGFLVAYLDIQPFIVTLAGMFFARGMTTIVNTAPFNVENEAFVKLKDTRVIVFNINENEQVGIVVDSVKEVMVISGEEIDYPSPFIKSDESFISGVGKKTDMLISILDINSLVDEKAIEECVA